MFFALNGICYNLLVFVVLFVVERHCEQARQFLKEKHLIRVLLTVSEDMPITIVIRSVVNRQADMVLGQ